MTFVRRHIFFLHFVFVVEVLAKDAKLPFFSVCVCVCAHACMRVCVRACVHVYTCVSVCLGVCVHMLVSVNVLICRH